MPPLGILTRMMTTYVSMTLLLKSNAISYVTFEVNFEVTFEVIFEVTYEVTFEVTLQMRKNTKNLLEFLIVFWLFL
jgi:hypothetical protein